MAIISTRVSQDKRNVSRVPAHLKCQVVYDGKSHDATIVNISLKGAFLSSPLVPPIGSTIVLVVKSRELKAPLQLEATVVRGTQALSDHGIVGDLYEVLPALTAALR